MRTDIRLKIVCSDCGREMVLDSDKNKSTFQYGSATKATIVLAIKPCKVCYEKMKKPFDLIKRGLDLME